MLLTGSGKLGASIFYPLASFYCLSPDSVVCYDLYGL